MYCQRYMVNKELNESVSEASGMFITFMWMHLP